MPTSRSKRPARSKVSKPGPKKPAAKHPAAKKAGKAPRPAARVKPAPKAPAKVAAKAPAKVVAKVPAKVVAKPPLKGKFVAVKGAPVGKAGKFGKSGKSGKSGKPAPPPPVVRPLGVLPPEARVRMVEKPNAVPPRPRPNPVSAAPNPATQGVQRVTEKDMKFFEERLLMERTKILKDMGHLENTVLKVNQRDSSGDLSGYSFHMADAGTDAMEREKAFMFASAEGRILMEIDDALRRLYQSEYGMCESCGNPIGRARLEAMPYARLCVSCKEKEEKANRGKGPIPAPSTP